MRFLRSEIVVTIPVPPEFAVWKTIKLGTGLKNADDFRKAIKKGGMRIGDWSNDILRKPAFKVSKTEIELDLVNVSVRELGFKQGAKRSDIITKALELGLQLCPSEVGPQLRLQYTDQPNGEWLLVGMDPSPVRTAASTFSVSNATMTTCGSTATVATLSASVMLASVSCLSVLARSSSLDLVPSVF